MTDGNCSGALYESANELESSAFPSLHDGKEGWPSDKQKCREASADREAGVVFRLRTERKTTPAASASVASQHFLDDAASPLLLRLRAAALALRGDDARRGITHHPHSFPFLYPPLQAP